MLRNTPAGSLLRLQSVRRLQLQAANRHDAAALAAKQQELAALEAEAARLSSSKHAQAEHEARFRTAAERYGLNTSARRTPQPCSPIFCARYC